MDLWAGIDTTLVEASRNASNPHPGMVDAHGACVFDCKAYVGNAPPRECMHRSQVRHRGRRDWGKLYGVVYRDPYRGRPI